MLSGELDSLRSQLDMLSDLSGQLVSASGQQETSKLDQVISDLTTEWQLTSDQCNGRLHQVDSALQQETLFKDELAVHIITFCLSILSVFLCMLVLL